MDGKDKTNAKTYNKGQYIGDYQVIDSIEQSKFTQIYLCQYQSRQFRVEVLRPPLMSDAREAFLTQARALMKLNHPNILRLRDAGVDNSNAYLVTEYVPCLTLRQVYKSGAARSLAKLLPYLKQSADALDTIHSQQLLHGDIRPENILLDRNNTILLSGFRIEAIEQNRERLHKVEATQEAVAYAAPERLQGKPVPASDQYSLAIIVYEFLSGAVPFTGSYIEIAEKQAQAVPPLLRDKGVSSRIEQIVMKALSKEPRKRYTDVEMFIRALETEVAREQGISLPPSMRKAPPPPPVQPINVSLHQQSVVPAPSRPPQRDATLPASAPIAAPAAFNAAPAPRVSSGTAQVAQQAVQQNYVPPAPPLIPSAPAPRRGENNKVSRRAFAVGLVAVAALGGAGGWYALSKKLAPPAVPTITPNETPPATTTTVNNKSALIFTGHLAAVNAVSWSPDGRLIASASDDTYVIVFDAATGKRRVLYTGHTKEVKTVDWAPNGRLIASAGQDGTVQIWDANTGRTLLTYRGHSDRVNSVAWSSDGLFIVSGSEDKTVQVWNSSNGSLIFNFKGHTAGVLCVGWEPGNHSVASGSWDGTLRDWATVQHGNHFKAGEQIFDFGGHGKGEVAGLSWSPDGNFIASAGADQTVLISNGVDGTPRPPAFIDHRDPQQVNPVLAVDWAPGGADIASGDSEGKVLVWHTAGRKTFFTYRGHKKAIKSVAWSPDGKRIASASSDATVHIWQPS
jgi:eukaryotic-like serine/threonine-protein kinase